MSKPAGASMAHPPHLLHLGFPLTGGWILRDWFARHPGLTYRPDHLGGEENGPALLRSLSRPFDLARPMVSSFDQLILPFAVGKLPDPDLGTILLPQPDVRRGVLQVLQGLFPEAQVLLVVRGFADMLRAMHAAAIRTGSTASLAAFVAKMADRQQRGLGPLDYDQVRQEILALMPAQQVLVLPFELLQQDPQQVATLLAHRLGLDPEQGGAPEMQRPGKRLPYAGLAAIRQRTQQINALPVGKRLRQVLLTRHLARANKRSVLPPPDKRTKAQKQASRPEDLPAELLEAWRGCAIQVAGLPAFAPFQAEYLADG